MKVINKIKVLGIFVVTVLFFISCELGTNHDYGLSKVYMPQASLQSGGSDNNYYVPSGETEWDQNYSIEGDEIKVVLGVYRSGLEELDEYSVDIVARPDTVNQLIDDGIFPDAQLLPEEVYSLPSSVTVPNGERENIFYLTIDRNTLLDNYPSYADSQLILAVSIDNPSKYEINKALNTTIVVLSDEWDTLEE